MYTAKVSYKNQKKFSLEFTSREAFYSKTSTVHFPLLLHIHGQVRFSSPKIQNEIGNEQRNFNGCYYLSTPISTNWQGGKLLHTHSYTYSYHHGGIADDILLLRYIKETPDTYVSNHPWDNSATLEIKRDFIMLYLTRVFISLTAISSTRNRTAYLLTPVKQQLDNVRDNRQQVWTMTREKYKEPSLLLLKQSTLAHGSLNWQKTANTC